MIGPPLAPVALVVLAMSGWPVVKKVQVHIKLWLSSEIFHKLTDWQNLPREVWGQSLYQICIKIPEAKISLEPSEEEKLLVLPDFLDIMAILNCGFMLSQLIE